MLEGKKVLIAVCGSIAAYKTAFFVRLLVKAGAEVKVIMTASAQTFISPLTLATLSKNPAHSAFQKNEAGEWNNHVELGLWADLMVVAPLSANTLAKFANGGCDNLVSAVYLSARCPVMVCPAMDLDMYQHPATRKNLKTLSDHGNIIIDATDGELASGLHGEGRMAEPEDILHQVTSFFTQSQSFKGKKVMITSGPTQEAIDPVRYIGNHSTGKMGTAIALELAHRGAEVEFISGSAAHIPRHPLIKVTKVTSADEMYETARSYFDDSDIAIFSAAVADYKPEQKANSKIKKSSDTLNISLVPNPDIAKELGAIKQHQYTVGFALETDEEQSNARKKLASKNLDAIVLNSLNDDGAGFAHDTNRVTIFDRYNNHEQYELKSKAEVAKDLVDFIEKSLNV